MTGRVGRWIGTVLGALVLVLGLLFVVGDKSVRAEVTIEAPPERVWAALMDQARYGEWHPVIVASSGPLEPGATLVNTMRVPDGTESVVESTVKVVEPNRHLNQWGGMRGILTFDHHYRLEAVPAGTRLVQYERYRGIAVPFWDPAWVEAGYAQANEALRDLLER